MSADKQAPKRLVEGENASALRSLASQGMSSERLAANEAHIQAKLASGVVLGTSSAALSVKILSALLLSVGLGFGIWKFGAGAAGGEKPREANLSAAPIEEPEAGEREIIRPKEEPPGPAPFVAEALVETEEAKNSDPEYSDPETLEPVRRGKGTKAKEGPGSKQKSQQGIGLQEKSERTKGAGQDSVVKDADSAENLPKPSSDRTETPALTPGSQSNSDLSEQIALMKGAKQAAARGQYQSALSLLDRLEAKFPDSLLKAEAELSRVEYLLRAKKNTDAERWIRRLLTSSKHRGRRAQLWHSLGDLYLRQGRCAEAGGAFEKAEDSGADKRQLESAARGLSSCAKSAKKK